MLLRLVRYLYLCWIALWLLSGFLLLFPLFWLIIRLGVSWHKYYHPLTLWWARVFYAMIGVPVRAVWQFKPHPRQTYIYCPNHYSVMDIPLLTRTIRHFFVFVGLHDIARVPLFGYMYRHIHIIINRGSLRDRYLTYQKCKQAIRQGKSLVIFPEGGIWATDFPRLAPFKEGAFRMAIELQVPIVPVTIPYNWQMLPVYDFSRLAWHRQEVVFHSPISTKGLTVADTDALKDRVFVVIEAELKARFGEHYPTAS